MGKRGRRLEEESREDGRKINEERERQRDKTGKWETGKAKEKE